MMPRLFSLVQQLLAQHIGFAPINRAIAVGHIAITIAPILVTTVMGSVTAPAATIAIAT